MCVTAWLTIILADEKQKTKGVGYVDSFIQGWLARLDIAYITISSSCTNRKREKSLNLCHSLTCVNNFGQHSPLAPPGAKSQSKIPSRLRESSIALSLEIEGTGASPGSRSSSPATAVTPTSSIHGRPNGIPAGSIVEEKKIPARIPSPPRPPPPVTRRPETDYLIGKHVVLCYFCVRVSVNDGDPVTGFLDVEGDETGSSTDTGSE